VCALFGIIAAGTALSFALHKARPGALLRRPEPAPAGSTAQNSGTQNAQEQTAAGQTGQRKTIAYTGLGQIRTPTKPQSSDSEPAIVLISPWFSYPPNDSPFYEELAAKNRKLKVLFSDYFSRYTVQELLAKGEVTVKNDLIDLINSELVLGSLSDLYFEEYLFFD
jgi:flagellar basal body-associated protein FliL